MRRAWRRSVLACVTAAAAGTGAAASGQVIVTQWNFNSNPSDGNVATGSLTPSIGLGAASSFGGLVPVFATGDNSGGSSDPATGDDSGWQAVPTPPQGSLSGQRGIEFAVSTVNFGGITVTFDTRHSGSCSRYIQAFYSLDGTNFVPGPVYDADMGGDRWYNGRTLDLTGVAGASDNANFKFRLAPVFAPGTGGYVPPDAAATYASGGATLRYDMVTVSGTPLSTTNPSGNAAVSPAAVCTTGGQFTLSVLAIGGQAPPSTGLGVTANLAALGVGTATLTDDGLNGDVTAGDNVFTAVVTVGAGVSTGVKNIPITVSDAQMRTGAAGASVTVVNCAASSSARVVISQVFGGGSNAGPPVGTYNADFVEIYNRTGQNGIPAQTVDLTGWSVQYSGPASPGGFDGAADQVMLSGAIKPGQYMLIRYKDAGNTGLPIPPADFATAPGAGGMGNTGGRVALVRNTALIGTNCASADVEDLVGYGAAACFEGASATVATANDSAAIRKSGGAQDTDQNFNDFVVSTPTPRNRSTGGFLAGYPSATPTIVCAGSQLTLKVAVTPGQSPTSTGITVAANLTMVGGGVFVPLHDDGLNGDAAPGDGEFTLLYTVPGTVTQGVKAVGFAIDDNQGRSDNPLVSFSVATCNASAASIVVSQFYGGGGNVGSPFNADYIEIHNRSGAPVNVDGWSVQYSDATNTTGFLANRTVPLAGVIAPGAYRLIRTNAEGVNGGAIPAADFTPAAPFGMDNQAGRIAVVSSTTALGTDCGSASIVDLVGYGPSSLCFEGLATTPGLDNDVVAYRKLNGCQDTNQNAVDFEVLMPLDLPRNSASAASVCVIPVTGVCCRGTTCNTTVAQASCTAPGAGIGAAYAAGPLGNSCNVVNNRSAPCCYADFNKAAGVTVQDIFDFLAAWFAGSPYARYGGNGTGGAPTAQSIFDFLAAWFGGPCPAYP